jgi:UDP-glucose 4-epimerase
MKILILGSEGFIGSNAVAYFNKSGHEVYKADIIIKEEAGYSIINPEHTDFPALFSGLSFDACINATGSANVQFSFANPVLDYSLNVSNVFFILDAIRRYSPGCRFINLSSAAVYGNPVQLPITEKSNPMPLSPYGWHKLYSEQVCKEFHDYFGLHTISLRIFSAYGEGLKKQLFWDLYQKVIATEDKTISLFGSGLESRDFIYIKDLMRAIECVMLRASFDGGVINTASGREVLIKDAVTLFLKLFEPGLKIIFSGASKKGDPLNWCADISKLQLLGFKEISGLQEGLQNYYKWLPGKK